MQLPRDSLRWGCELAANHVSEKTRETDRAVNGSTRAVCHFVRSYLRTTETFIANQIAVHESYEPTVICRGLDPSTSVTSTVGPLPTPIVYRESDRVPATEELLYRWARITSTGERRSQVSALVKSGACMVHGHYGTDSSFILGAVASAGLPLVVSHYGYDVSRFPSAYRGLGSIYLRPVWERADFHLAMTPQMADELRDFGVPADRLVVHHHGIDLRTWSTGVGEPSSVPLVLMVASLVEKKGHETAIQAFADIVNDFPAARLRIVGDGPLRVRIERLAATLGVRERVDFLGYLPHGSELLQEYRRASVFLHPSQTARNGDAEGLPGSILEAMACGLPVVATRHQGIPYAVEDGISGFLVAEGDKDAAAHYLRVLLADSVIAGRLGEAGTRRVRMDFDVRVQGPKREAIYDSVISRRRLEGPPRPSKQDTNSGRRTL